MSAIKLPVESYEGIDGSWFVKDRKSRLCQSLTKPQAVQITTALNMHDELVEAAKQLQQIKRDPFGVIQKLLERAEAMNETKPTNP